MNSAKPTVKPCQKTMGRPAKDGRLVIGALILKHFYRYNDEETIEQNQMNPYYQYFV
ncbi:MAG TPA: transposase [Thiotrichaceae bacterium]|nr:transposase [Thiotrichaceae bacterium]